MVPADWSEKRVRIFVFCLIFDKILESNTKSFLSSIPTYHFNSEIIRHCSISDPHPLTLLFEQIDILTAVTDASENRHVLSSLPTGRNSNIWSIQFWKMLKVSIILIWKVVLTNSYFLHPNRYLWSTLFRNSVLNYVKTTKYFYSRNGSCLDLYSWSVWLIWKFFLFYLFISLKIIAFG